MNQIRLVYQKSALTKVLFWTGLIILSLLLAYVVETYFYHTFRFNNNRATLDDVTIGTRDLNVDGNTYYVRDLNPVISIKFPEKVFINELVFETSAPDHPITYEAVYVDDYDIREKNVFPAFENSIKTVVVNGTVSKVELYIYESPGTTFTLDLIDIVYDLNPNYLRMSVLFVMFFVFFFLLASFFLRYSKKVQTLVLVLSFGLIFAVLVPPNYDNFSRNELYRSYLLSQGQTTLEHKEEITTPIDLASLGLSYRSYDEFNDHLDYIKSLNNDETIETEVEAPFGTSVLAYFPSAAAVMLGSLFDANFYTILILTRVFNAIIYAILVTLAVALIPEQKLLFFSLTALSGLLYYTSGPGSLALVSGSLFLSLSLLSRVRQKKNYVTLGFLVLFSLIVASYSFYTAFFLFILLLVPKEYFGKLYSFYIILVVVITFGLFALLLVYSTDMFPITQEIYDYFIDYPLFFITRFFAYLRDEIFAYSETTNSVTGLGLVQNNFGVFRYFTPLFLMLIAFNGKGSSPYNNTLSRTVLPVTAFLMLCSYLIVSYLRNSVPTGNFFTLEFLALPALILALVLPCLKNTKFYFNTRRIFDDLMVLYSYLMLYCDITILLRMFYA